MTDRVILLNSSRASFPYGRKLLDTVFTFSPPLQFKGDIALVNLNLQTTGLLYEVDSRLEYATPEDADLGNWTPLPDAQTLYCRSLQHLAQLLAQSLSKLTKTRSTTAIYSQDTGAITIKAGRFHLRFSQDLRRVLRLQTNILKPTEHKSSIRQTKDPLDMPKIWPITLHIDCMEINAVIPSGTRTHEPCRTDTIVYYFDATPEDSPFETIVPARLLFCKPTAATIQQARVTFRYAGSGRPVRVLGNDDFFHIALIDRRRLALSL